MDEERYAHVLDSIDGALGLDTGDMYAGVDGMRWIPPEDASSELESVAALQRSRVRAAHDRWARAHPPTVQVRLYTEGDPVPVRTLDEASFAYTVGEIDEEGIQRLAEYMATETIRMRAWIVETVGPAMQQAARVFTNAIEGFKAVGFQMPEPDDRSLRERALDAVHSRNTGPQERPGGRYGKPRRRVP
jgi:hypothetical protein